MTDGRQLEPKQTVTTPKIYVLSIMRRWRREFARVPTKEQVGVLRAQYMCETGDRACWNWNIGNIKKVDGDGYDWHYLDGTWEGVAPADYARMKGQPFVELDNPEFYVARYLRQGKSREEAEAEAKAVVAAHNAAVAPKISVLFHPPHPFARFRAYPSLEVALEKKWALFRSPHYAACWPHVDSGNADAFARAIGSASPPYYTASASAYAAAVVRCFDAWMKTAIYEDALRELLAEMDAPTAPSLPVDAEPIATRFDWTMIVDEDVRDAVRDGTTISMVDMARQAINDRNDGD